MKKRILFFLSLALAASLSIGWFSLKDSVEAQSAAQDSHPLDAINQKAKVARNGGLSEAKDLVGEIVKVSGFDSELRGFALDTIKDRVGRSESRYRLGLSNGIPEAKIVRTINGLAGKFDLPNFTRTNQYEVRKLRIELFPNLPQVINRANSHVPQVSSGSNFGSMMSPAEATLVLLLMVQQKLHSEDYQITHAEMLSQWAATHDHSSTQRRSVNSGGRSRQVFEALNRAISTTSVSDALRLSNLTLNTLGIEQ